MKKRARQYGPVPVTLTTAERALVVRDTFVEGDLLARLESAPEPSPGKLHILLTADQFEELLEWVAEAMNHCEDRALAARLDAVYEKLERFEGSSDLRDLGPWRPKVGSS